MQDGENKNPVIEKEKGVLCVLMDAEIQDVF